MNFALSNQNLRSRVTTHLTPLFTPLLTPRCLRCQGVKVVLLNKSWSHTPHFTFLYFYAQFMSVHLHLLAGQSCLKYFKNWENVFPLHMVSYVSFKKPRDFWPMYQYNVLIIYGQSKYMLWQRYVTGFDSRSHYQMMTSIAYQIKTIQIPKQIHKMNNARFGFDCFWQTLSTARTVLIAIAADWIHLGHIGSTRVTQIC